MPPTYDRYGRLLAGVAFVILFTCGIAGAGVKSNAPDLNDVYYVNSTAFAKWKEPTTLCTVSAAGVYSRGMDGGSDFYMLSCREWYDEVLRRVGDGGASLGICWTLDPCTLR